MKNLLFVLWVAALLSACEKTPSNPGGNSANDSTTTLDSTQGIDTSKANYTLIKFVEMCDGALYGAGAEKIHKHDTVIRDNSSWVALKNKMNTTNVTTINCADTTINFSDSIIVVAFEEVKGSGGYDVIVKNIIEYMDTVFVSVEHTIPKGLVITVMEQPFHLVKIPATNKPIVFK